jgi:two-component sensor histidine kinase
VSDLTDVIAADALKARLISEKDVLMQEVQHRVANSLQIIASVLMQNARKIQSDESRMHLKDAHQRVMSVAAVQRQLAESRLGDVAVKPYLTQLCGSLGASMIADHDQLLIVVEGDDSTTSPEASVSLGLIVTELVINALKHAFPDGRKGRIVVTYRSTPAGWTLSIEDDGIGIPTSGAAPRAGLGTSIVNALATQLSAVVTTSDLKPGVGIAIVHVNAGAVDQPDGEDVVAV